MAKIVLKDGTILDATADQYDRLVNVILFAPDLSTVVQINGYNFRLDEMVDDPEVAMQLMQGKMFEMQPVKPKRKQNTNDLA